MEKKDNLPILNSQDIQEIAELIKSPDIDSRQIGARKLAKVAIMAVMTQDGGRELSELISNNRSMDGYGDRKSLERCQSLIEGVNDTIFSIDSKGSLSFMNSSVESITGYKNDELIGLSFADFVHPDDIDGVNDNFKQAFAGNGKPHEFRIIDKNGDTRWMRTSSGMQLENGEPCGIAGLMLDITDRKASEEKLKNMSLIDSLTGVYSRNHLEEQSAILKTSRRYPISVVNIDIDGLHDINNNEGHAAGDELLKAVGVILKEVFRQEDCVARAGGDEFVVLLPETDTEAANYAVDRIKVTLDEYNNEHLNKPELSLSVGVATACNSSEWDKTMKLADDLMYEVKKSSGKNRA